LKEFHPPYPGRLNELLHIVHVDANLPTIPGPHHFPVLSNPNLYKENIDGEALTWAYSRLIANPRPTKILIVISDGAPVDDSTLASNWPTILADHLHATVAEIVNEGVAQLGAIGVLFDVSHYYPCTASATSNDKLPVAATELVHRMIENSLEAPLPPK
jgi:cobaltochelatase CobT